MLRNELNLDAKDCPKTAQFEMKIGQKLTSKSNPPKNRHFEKVREVRGRKMEAWEGGRGKGKPSPQTEKE